MDITSTNVMEMHTMLSSETFSSSLLCCRLVSSCFAFPLPAFSCFQVALLLLPTQMIRKLPDFIKHYGKTGELVAIRS